MGYGLARSQRPLLSLTNVSQNAPEMSVVERILWYLFQFELL